VREDVIKRRLRRLAWVVARVLVTLAVGAVAGAVVVFLTTPGGSISCVAPPSAARPEPIPRWVITAGAPAVIAALVGAYFALGAESVGWRLIGLVFALAVAAGTFYGVYVLLPVNCRP
jgi:membrane associated rhomboid family serine protease